MTCFYSNFLDPLQPSGAFKLASAVVHWALHRVFNDATSESGPQVIHPSAGVPRLLARTSAPADRCKLPERVSCSVEACQGGCSRLLTGDKTRRISKRALIVHVTRYVYTLPKSGWHRSTYIVCMYGRYSGRWPIDLPTYVCMAVGV